MFTIKTFVDDKALTDYLNAMPEKEHVVQMDLTRRAILVNTDLTPTPPDSAIVVSCVSETDPKTGRTKTVKTFKDGHKEEVISNAVHS